MKYIKTFDQYKQEFLDGGGGDLEDWEFQNCYELLRGDSEADIIRDIANLDTNDSISGYTLHISEFEVEVTK